MGRQDLKGMEEALSLIMGEITIYHEAGGEVIIDASDYGGDPLQLSKAILEAARDIDELEEGDR